jgi:DNA polymerase-3 subunit alpha
MNNHYTFDCGCKIPIIDGKPQIDFHNLNLECPKTWEIYKKGYTSSVFQLGSYLGRKYSKELEPDNMNDAAALIAIIRPATLQTKDSSGKSLTQKFCDIKTERDELDPNNPLAIVASETYGIIVFQETIMRLAVELAGFSAVDSLKFMKTTAKKNAEALFAFEEKFLDGCEKVGKITRSQASVIFDNIKNASRYCFCLAHSVGYAQLGYQMAWCVAHLPKQFLCAQFKHCKDSPDTKDEIRRIAAEARRLGIKIKPPSVKNLPYIDSFIEEDAIYFALNSVKDCGDKGFAKIQELNIDFRSLNWVEFLIMYSQYLNKKQIKSMARTGCFDYMDIPRKLAEYEYDQWSQLTKTEQKNIRVNYESNLYLNLYDAISDAKITEKRKPIVDAIKNGLINPPVSLEDSAQIIVENERELLGISLTCSGIQTRNAPQNKDNCGDVEKRQKEYYNVAGEITEYREFKIKNGKLKGQYMSSFKMQDESGECDIVCFPNSLSQYESCLFDGNICLIEGKISNRGSGLILNTLHEL